MGASKMAPFFSGHTGAMPVEYYRVQHDRVMRQYEILDFFSAATSFATEYINTALRNPVNHFPSGTNDDAGIGFHRKLFATDAKLVPLDIGYVRRPVQLARIDPRFLHRVFPCQYL